MGRISSFLSFYGLWLNFFNFLEKEIVIFRGYFINCKQLVVENQMLWNLFIYLFVLSGIFFSGNFFLVMQNKMIERVGAEIEMSIFVFWDLGFYFLGEFFFSIKMVLLGKFVDFFKFLLLGFLFFFQKDVGFRRKLFWRKQSLKFLFCWDQILYFWFRLDLFVFFSRRGVQVFEVIDVVCCL